MPAGGDSDRISDIPLLSVSNLNKIQKEHRCKFNVLLDPDTLEKFIMYGNLYSTQGRYKLV